MTQDLPELGLFDVIFLRNVMIYFSQDVKRQVLKHLMKRLRPDGYLVIGHSETLNGLETGMRAVVPSIYQMP
ncbi:CheR family methyltransferase [Candidatus Reidiella endopervernicosa]|uniref:CheR-type methyltransferase domain-containing protein n=1 Tax=Candidatus Reidiella endopervernicosa TaxID=2738883 RepID=A0A6N0I0Y1_9GAMM|nr:CheR family methyltransferase [Candidatus Reidiella endopervernicosa]QKQ28245.1 hypothetical protein HUE57_11540 [Candidatus Reidiella endopervernicosa]